MRRWLLDLLACPDCAGDSMLRLENEAADGEEIITGRLICNTCGRHWPVTGGIPRFVAQDDDYATAFGWQWRRWRTVQIDHLNGHRFSEQRLLKDSGWPRGWFAGRLVLDAGCGAGRFSDVMGELGARVVAFDLSGAIDAARETCARHDGRVQCVQASIYALPLRRGAFDAVHCAGVIQHTPDPARTMATLPAHLRPNGLLAYNFYEKSVSRRLQLVKYALRVVTPHLPAGALLALCRVLVAIFFPFTLVLSRVRYVRYFLRFLPICATHRPEMSVAEQYVWTLLDTFDWYNPRFEHAQDHRAVGALLKRAGLTDIVTAPGIARARRPAPEAPAQASSGAPEPAHAPAQGL